MRLPSLILAGWLLIIPLSASAGFLDDVLGGLGGSSSGSGVVNSALSLEKTISGLKEALSVGTGNAVTSLSKVNGFLNNEAIKILIPEKIRGMTDMLRKMGFDQVVDNFETSMNHAAEQASEQAKPIFLSAIKDMSFDDAKQILNGGDTAATDYLKKKTFDQLSAKFQPVITDSLNKAGATGYYQDMVSQVKAIPFVDPSTVDLEPYVTNKALDGMFLTVAEEEKKIRTNPEARVTDLLQEVFGK